MAELTLTEQKSLLQRYDAVTTRLAQLRSPPPRLLAVSKFHSAAAVACLFRERGQRFFGENYVTELEEKAEVLKELPLHWVFIGQLQSNKIRRIMEIAHEIQTVASLKHARACGRIAAELQKKAYPLYLEVNAGSEEQKSGLDFAQAQEVAAEITASPFLQLQGVMAIPPAQYQDEKFPKDVPELYTKLRQLAHRVGAGQLSLGMTGDLAMACRAGSDDVRIGTAIFGPRPSKGHE